MLTVRSNTDNILEIAVSLLDVIFSSGPGFRRHYNYLECGTRPGVRSILLCVGHYEHRAVSQSHHRDREKERDRKSTRLNSSHQIISYAVFCLKKKKKK